MPPVDLTRTLHLVEQAQAGDRDSLDRLIARYYDRVLRIVRIRLGKKLRRDFESGDILQDAFVVAVKKFDEFEMRDEASFIRWLRTIVEHQITDKADYVDAERRNRAHEVESEGKAGNDGEPVAIEPEAAQTGPLDALVKREGMEQVERFLAGLDEKYRELILMRDYEGHSWDRIAELCDRPSEDAARMMYRKALLELGMAIRNGRAAQDQP